MARGWPPERLLPDVAARSDRARREDSSWERQATAKIKNLAAWVDWRRKSSYFVSRQQTRTSDVRTDDDNAACFYLDLIPTLRLVSAGLPVHGSPKLSAPKKRKASFQAARTPVPGWALFAGRASLHLCGLCPLPSGLTVRGLIRQGCSNRRGPRLAEPEEAGACYGPWRSRKGASSMSRIIPF